MNNGIEFINRENPSNMTVLEGESKAKTKVFYDGIIYPSQAEMARQTGINKATINSWLKGKNKMPKEIKEKGLKYYE